MKFSEVAVGQKIKFNDVEYTKIEAERVSCCRTNNVVNLADNSKTMIKPDADVELVTE